ncbi:T9SS type A sorting domain-containing protein [Flavobacterium beibuense]|nr:T9SS type A sorting domain-containing protein [Flavobacterium beibuense]
MKKNYFYITLLFFFLMSFSAAAQDSKGNTAVMQQQNIEDLNIYPNPVSSDRVYITSKSGQSKEVEIYDVLGKKILQATITGKELNISNLTAGVYIVKVKEGEATATRKLIVK